MIRLTWLGVAAAALVASASCGSSAGGGHAATRSSTPTPGRATVHIVALGDSDATGIGDNTGRGWVGRYGDLVKQTLNTPVAIDNFATESRWLTLSFFRSRSPARPGGHDAHSGHEDGTCSTNDDEHSLHPRASASR